QTWSYSTDVTADASGAFTLQFALPTTFIASYAATATGAISGSATASFTDAAKLQFALANQDTVTPTSWTVNWLKSSDTTNCTGTTTTGSATYTGSTSNPTAGAEPS